MTAARPSSLGRLSQRGASPRPSAVASAAGGSLQKTQRSPLSGQCPGAAPSTAAWKDTPAEMQTPAPSLRPATVRMTTGSRYQARPALDLLPLSGGVPTPSRVEPFNGRAHHPSAAIIITRYVPAGPRSQAEGQGTPLTGPLKAAANHTPCFTLPTAPPASCWGLFLAPALA